MFKTRVFIVGCLSIFEIAHGDVQSEKKAGFVAIFTVALVEHCIRVDDLLRSTCVQIGPHLSGKNGEYCNLEAKSFRARTADSYEGFKRSFATVIADNRPRLNRVLEKTRESFRHQFAQVILGNTSMFELESLSRELKGRCLAIEEEGFLGYRKYRYLSPGG
ncbi:hypothetical protein ACFL17_06030 [Pseudomonadota bacterium]